MDTIFTYAKFIDGHSIICDKSGNTPDAYVVMYRVKSEELRDASKEIERLKQIILELAIRR